MGTIRVSILFSIIDRYAAQILLIVTTAIMARLLTPAETGLFLVANALIMLADNFRTFGVGVYIIQAPVLTRDTVRSAFTLTLLLSLGIGTAVFVGADGLARFYWEPEIARLLRLAALSFLIIPFSSPLIAMLQREMKFRALAAINVIAALAGATVTISLALADMGPASYALGFVAQSLALTLAAFALRPEPWVFLPSFRDMGKVGSFGTVSSFVAVVNIAADQLPRLAFGKILGVDAVALYGRATTICQIPDRLVTSAIQPVVMPIMAARIREGGDLKSAYLRGHEMMSAVQWPMLVMLAVLADPVVRLLLGAQWTEVPPLVRLIALASMALAPAFMTFPLLVSLGRIRDTLWSSLIALPPSVLIISLAATISLEAVAASLFIVAPFQMLVALYFIRRAIGLSWADLVSASTSSLVITAGTLVLPAVFVLHSNDGMALGWAESTMAILGAGLGWLTAIWLVGHPLLAELGTILRPVLVLLRTSRLQSAPALGMGKIPTPGGTSPDQKA